ncbi:MAG: VOC family protein [Myxococcota bacterium]|nr:VOC family protein [Myxococcales bacterium]
MPDRPSAAADRPAAPGPIAACHHVAVCVGDAEAARRFYGGALGLEEIPRPPEVAVPGAWYRLGATELHVFEAKGYAPPRSPSFPPHFAVFTADFDASVERLRAAGARFDFGPGTDAHGIRRVVLRDPTGNVVEVTDAPLGEAR